MILRDVLYGEIEIPGPLVPFLRLPEFVRLRGVRLSNVDSIQFKDLNGPTRWEHAIGVLHLALICAEARRMTDVQRMHLCLAALLHDVATPPFAHTAEYVLSDFDHELETSRLLSDQKSQDVSPDTAVYLSEAPQFRKECSKLSHLIGARVDPDEVASMVIGEGDLGYLISGTLDLDNADNVTRASLFMGFRVDPELPERLASWLATQDSAPIDLHESLCHDVVEWLKYRSQMYGAFYKASDDERGREAYLQHLFRRADSVAIPRKLLVWNTDEGFLTLLSQYKGPDDNQGTSMYELVRRYRLLETPHLLFSLKIMDDARFRVLRLAEVASWIERKLSTEYMEVIASVSARRFSADEEAASLLPPEVGQVQIFKLGPSINFDMLPAWLQDKIGRRVSGQQLIDRMRDALMVEMDTWIAERPWFTEGAKRRSRAQERLEAMGDWSFRKSTNEGFHVYPATFVHTIPASLIYALDVAGDNVLDCFGGTGQTAIEAIKAGGVGISADSNAVASLVARARTTYLSSEKRRVLRSITEDDLWSAEAVPPPDEEGIERWHNARTLEELQHIKGYIDSTEDPNVRLHLQVAFSAILTNTTARRGRQHGFFADNTPLERGQTTAPYVNAIALFLRRVIQNTKAAEAIYASLERSGGKASEELLRAKVLHLDARASHPTDYGVAPKSISAIITSPPYLCMTDYTLGNRLSYYWLFPEQRDEDFEHEIGPRRRRPAVGSPKARVDGIVSKYLDDLKRFSQASTELLRDGGYMAIVLGTPVATAFENYDILDQFDVILADYGYKNVWSTWRSIYWHRNHGYARLKTERLSVHQLHG